jgi:hypothetical protein
MVATSQGHLDQTRKNYKSTKPRTAAPPAAPKPDPVSISDGLDTFPVLESVLTNFVYTKVKRTDHSFMDNTGRFSVKSRTGNEYNLIMYNYDANYIHVEPMKRARSWEITRCLPPR